MDSLIDGIIRLILIEPVPHEDKVFLTNLVSELLGSRKDWLTCLQRNLVLPNEVASGIMGHIYTVDCGRFSDDSVVNFKNENKLANLLSSST